MLPDPRILLKKYDLKPKKSWGQNFLLSSSAVQKIADICQQSDAKTIIEIGAGLGSLTFELLKGNKKVIAIELDRDLYNVLKSEFSDKNLKITHADAAAFNYAEELNYKKGIITGNLPYHITGRLLRKIANLNEHLYCAIVMVQKEVAKRLVAPAGTSLRAALSVIQQSRFAMKIVHNLKPTAFFPKPKVSSSIVYMKSLEPPLFKDLNGDVFNKIVKAAFGNKRKTVLNSLKKSDLEFPVSIESMLEKASIPNDIRPARITNEQFVKLTQIYLETRN